MRVRKLRAIAMPLAALVFVPTIALAQLAPPNLDAAVDQYLRPLIDLNVFSGVVLIAQGDSVVLENAYGLANVELHVRMRSDNAFRIASISKSFTRALIGRLADRGILKLDDKLSRWIPDFTSSNAITVRMLLDHRAGVTNTNSLPYDEESITPNNLALLVNELKRKPLDYAPGTQYRYSNGGYAVLAAVVEQVTGRPFDQVLRDEILVPLTLAHTQHEHDGELIDKMAHGVMPSSETPDLMIAAPFQQMSTKTGGGSLVSTARDLHQWARAIGRSRILAQHTWKDLFPNDTLFVFDGRSPGYMSLVLYDRGTTVVILANNYAANSLSVVAHALCALLRNEKPPALPVVSPTAASLDGLEGTYLIPDGIMPLPHGSVVDVRRNAKHLVAWIKGVPSDVLIPQAERSFLMRNQALLVTFDAPAADGSPAVSVRSLYGGPSFRALRAPVQPNTSKLDRSHVDRSNPATSRTYSALFDSSKFNAADSEIPQVLATALQFYSPMRLPIPRLLAAQRQMRWIERSQALDSATYDAVFDKLDDRFAPASSFNSQQTGGILHVTMIQKIDANHWAVIVSYRHHSSAFTGQTSSQLFHIVQHNNSYTIESRSAPEDLRIDR